jgi:hypothetical protein
MALNQESRKRISPKKIEPTSGGRLDWLATSYNLLHRKHQIVVIVVCPRSAGRRASLISELRPHRLQAARRKRKRRRQRLRSGLGRFNRRDKHPRRTVRIRRVVKVERVGSESAPRPNCCRHGRRSAVRQRSAARRCHHDPIVGLIRMEGPAAPIGAGTNGVRLMRLRTARHVIPSQQERRSRVTRRSDRRAFRSLQR